MPDVEWHAEHSVEVNAPIAHAWNVRTDVSKWDDPPAQFVLDGATILIDLDRATLAFIWRFDRVSGA